MVKEGPCGHCRTEQTPLWRNGPPAKPVLCNACGSRWRTRGTLDDYTPKHAMKEVQGIQTEEASGSGSPSSKAITTGPSQLIFENVPRRKRSALDQYVITSVGRFNKQLLDFAHKQPQVYLDKSMDEDVLIDRADIATSNPLGTALGALLLVPPFKKIKTIGYESVEVVKVAEVTFVSDLKGNNDDH